jgi:hypothetical protein
LKSLRAFLIIALALFCHASAFAAEPVHVKTTVDSKTVHIGDNVKYSISLTVPKSFEVEFSDMGKAFKDFIVIDSGIAFKSFLNEKTETKWFILRTFTAGKYTILQQAVKYKQKQDKEWKEILGTAESIEVKSLIDEGGSNAALADIKGPVNLSQRINFFVLLVIVVFLGILFFWKKIFSAKKKAPTVIVEPWKAHEIAYAQFDELERKDLLARSLIKQYYSELSDILRHYLENRFSLKAPEMTTEEFISYVRDYSELERGHKDILREFLLNCDLVKFARYIPPESEGSAVFATARHFVDQTKTRDGSEPR